MKHTWTHLLFVMPRLIFESLNIMMIFLIMKAIFYHFEIGYIAVLSVGIVTLSYLLNKRLTAKQSLAVGGALALALGLVNLHFSVFFRLVYVIYYLYLWFVGQRMNVNHESPAVYMKRFFFSMFIMLILMTTVGLSNIFYYVQELSVYFLVYGLAVMLYIGKLNIEAVYAERSANEIRGKKTNKYKGVILNMLVIFLIIFLISTALMKNADFFRDAFEMVLRPIGYLGERMSRFIEGRLIERSSEMSEGSMMGTADEVSEMFQETEEHRQRSETNYKLIGQVILILGLLTALTLYGRKLFKRNRIIEVETEEYKEIRENVFSSKLLYENTIGKLVDRAKGLFRGRRDSAHLEEIREKYRDTVKELLESGQKLVLSDTPDEILRKTVLIPEEREKFSMLTEVYKRCRYAKERPDKAEIDEVLLVEIDSLRQE